MAIFLTAAVIASASPRLSSAHAATCPNGAIRSEQGEAALALPDCRAYELASPGSIPYLEAAPSANTDGARASTLGGAISYFTRYPAENAARSGFRYLAVRGASGWSVEEVAPQDSPQASGLFACMQALYFSPDLSWSVLSDGWNGAEQIPGEAYCGESEEALAPGARSGYGNLFLRDTATGTYGLLNLTPEAAAPANAYLQDATPDFSHVLFSEEARLTPEAPAGFDLYEWAAGALRLVPFLPDGAPTVGYLADGSKRTGALHAYEGHEKALAPETHAVSNDGERVFFYAEHEGAVGLYLRLHATQPPTASGECDPAEPDRACTVQVDAAQGGSGESGGGVFWDASPDGSRVFFADASKLTADSNASTFLEAADLYEYDLRTGKLTDLTPGASTERAIVRGFVGASADGSRLYFVAKGVLTGEEENTSGAKAVKGKPNLYLDREGVLFFIATLDPGTDFEDWQETNPANTAETNSGGLTSRVSPDGRYLAFASTNGLTGFDNTDPATGSPVLELFLYDAATRKLACASCAAAYPPSGSTALPRPATFSEKATGYPAYLTRNVLDDGRLFFTTPNRLLVKDTNGAADVYEYSEGHPHLISSGAAAGGSAFYDASPGGEDVFFVTSQSLVHSDADNSSSLYDARASGGFTEPPPPAACASETACRGAAAQPPPAFSPSTADFEGPSNPRCPKGFVRRQGGCVKKHHHKHGKHHKRNRRPHR